MNIQVTAPFPGSEASAHELISLASHYHKYATVLQSHGNQRDPLSLAPIRLLAVLGIELYLHAFLLGSGVTATQIRSLRHDFRAKAELATEKGLVLRQKTMQHMTSMTERREHVVLRYAPEMAASVSELNRVLASLEEVSGKVRRALAVPSPAIG